MSIRMEVSICNAITMGEWNNHLTTTCTDVYIYIYIILQLVYVYIPSLSKLLFGSLQNYSVVVGRPGQSPRDLGRFGRRDVIDLRGRSSSGGGAAALLLATVAGHYWYCYVVLCWKCQREMPSKITTSNAVLYEKISSGTMANDWSGSPRLAGGWHNPKITRVPLTSEPRGSTTRRSRNRGANGFGQCEEQPPKHTTAVICRGIGCSYKIRARGTGYAARLPRWRGRKMKAAKSQSGRRKGPSKSQAFLSYRRA